MTCEGVEWVVVYLGGLVDLLHKLPEDEVSLVGLDTSVLGHILCDRK